MILKYKKYLFTVFIFSSITFSATNEIPRQDKEHTQFKCKRGSISKPGNKPCSFSVTRVCGARPLPFARKFIGSRSSRERRVAFPLRKPSSGPRPRTLHNAQSHLPDHVRHRRLLRRPRARPRLRRAGASSGPRPSLARPADRLYRFAARHVARLFARAQV